GGYGRFGGRCGNHIFMVVGRRVGGLVVCSLWRALSLRNGAMQCIMPSHRVTTLPQRISWKGSCRPTMSTWLELRLQGCFGLQTCDGILRSVASCLRDLRMRLRTLTCRGWRAGC